MKIVLIQPKSCAFAEGHLWEPTSLGYLVGYAKSFNPEYNYKVMSAKFYSDNEILNECSDADLVGFTVTSPQLQHAGELSKQIEAPKVYGGVHPTIEPMDALKAGADIVVRGEGEVAFKKILDDIPGAVKKQTFSEPMITDLDTLPFPDREVIEQERYFEITMKNDNKRIASIFSSRGCPYNCTFCTSKALWTRGIRFRSAQSIAEEMEMLVNKWNIEFLKFSDDTFTIRKDRLLDFCKIKNERGINIPWGCNARVNNVNREIMRALKESNCQELWFGVESGSQRIMNVLEKAVTKEQVREAFKLAKEFGILTRSYFMIGNETETLEEIQETENFIEEIDPDIVGISINTPFPGSKSYIQKGMQHIDWKNVDLYNHYNGEGNKAWGNEYFNGEQLKQMQESMLNKFHHKLAARLTDKDFSVNTNNDAC